jgi:hypothetical protein
MLDFHISGIDEFRYNKKVRLFQIDFLTSFFLKKGYPGKSSDNMTFLNYNKHIIVLLIPSWNVHIISINRISMVHYIFWGNMNLLFCEFDQH